MSPPLTLPEFPPVSTAQWDEVVRQDLKGAAPKTRLYYRAEDLVGLAYLDAPPGRFPFTRGTRAANQWKIREVVSDPAAAQAALDGGADEIGYVLGAQDLAEVLDALPRCAVHFEAGQRAAEVALALASAGRPCGSVDYEPLGDFDRAAQIVQAFRALPDFQPVTLRAHRFAEAGGALAQELGCALAAGVEILAQLTDRGLPPDAAAGALAFSFAIGSNYFQEIAKLRAARTLWARVVESFHPASADAAKMTIHARTSRWTKTIYDPYVNVLRATTEAMAAVAGGADTLQVEPFDAPYRPPAGSAVRLARNLQLILKHEAWVSHTADAGGGSYYLESLTDSLAREAWALLQQIESAGGFLKYAASGALDRDLAQSRAQREAAVATRRAAIVGTNQYPNPQERMLSEIARTDPAPRAARVFEEIRLRTERHAARTGRTPLFLLLESGDLKMRKARASFSANFFGCAGFEIQIAETLSGDPDAVVLCSSDPEYAALAPQIIARLRAAGRSTPVIVAGHPADSMDQLKQAGVADFVHIRSNAAEMLRAWQQRLGVGD